MLNLEGPILPPGHGLPPSPKAGPNLFSTTPPRAAGQLICSLANNHIMDFGSAGLTQTLAILRECGALTVGAGNSPAAARTPLIVADGSARVAVIACAETQFGTAQPDRPGVAVLGSWVYGAIHACREQADAVVVSVHAGAEMSPWPAPALQDLYRSWIDTGAAVVHGHHAHVPQGYEEYGGGLILYGLGNLAINPRDWQEYPNASWSLGVDVDLASRPVKWRPLVLVIDGDERQLGLRQAPTTDYAAYLGDCHRPLSDRGLLAALWQEVALRDYHHHYRAYLRFPDGPQTGPPGSDPGMMARLRRSLRGEPRKPAASGVATRADHLLWYHLFACQTHADLVATALGVMGGEIADLRTARTAALADRWMPWTALSAAPGQGSC